MGKYKRSERTILLSKKLLENPNRVYPLREFALELDVAKSSMSEDIKLISKLFKEKEFGDVETTHGAAGGVKFTPYSSENKKDEVLNNLKEILSNSDRVLPGGYLYYSDVIYHPRICDDLGLLFATKYKDEKIDYVLTIETKGIPIAMAAAKYLDAEVVVARRENRVTEGPVMTINYISGSNRRIQTMSLNKRAMQPAKNVLVLDDFMKAGGTAKGLSELVKEYNCNLKGIGVIIDTEKPRKKLVDEYYYLLKLKNINELKREIVIGR
ncbi:pur operon repressor [Proteinivorax hydrogeniformans]|uniref:Pur operon repressor n=1 Tax=Proteinivorax hydrogeniformans TaxID=1826727 RepID=A0AAU8HT89_9FIRM